jgi:hypothetical protein
MDAANLYKDAFTLWGRLAEDQRRILSQPYDGLKSGSADELFQEIQPIMALLHQAAGAEYCDWAIGDVTPETPLPHLPKAQELAKLALWNAAHRISSDPDGAVQDLIARAHLGHHLSETLIGCMIAISFQNGAVGLLQQYGSALTPAAAERASELFSTPLLEPDLRRGMQAEAALAAAVANSSPEVRLRMLSHSLPTVEPTNAQGLECRRHLEEFLLDSRV